MGWAMDTYSINPAFIIDEAIDLSLLNLAYLIILLKFVLFAKVFIFLKELFGFDFF